ncbi:MAG: M23 family metallopeptidase [Sphingobacteriales bacterium]|nr:MAG: M23 family metallopeptidase [Sphingobacteriales bacterium]
MKKIKYFYNTNTLRYEKLVTPLRVKLLRVFGFIAATLVTAGLIIAIAYRYFPSGNEKRLRQENDELKDNYNVLSAQIQQLNQKLSDIEKRDNDVYRVIFESTPIPDSARAKAIAVDEEVKLVQRMSEDQLGKSIALSLSNIANRIAFQQKSFGDIAEMIKNKEKLLAAIPAIQPVSNKDLNRIASGFGYRSDPVYKVTKFHAGLDFTAPQGTPIYATADGRVETAGFSDGGYGNHVVINHGFGYETLYGHMVRVKARAGQFVKRGEVIGWVGSTGKSTGPHCHYEVHKNGTPIDPVYFFYNDLSPEQYDRLLKIASTKNQSFD